MAELLIYSCPGDQYGDIVAVGEDGKQWGTKECLSDFLVVCIPGMSLSDAMAVCVPYMDPIVPAHMIYQRRYRVDIESISPADMALVQSSDWYVPEIDAALIEDRVS